ncbi:family 43 glycosylhydrolase [Kribbella sp. NPDC056861]|uniref:family 43 glycosylhydrolase n=1 Tax=Kribbella sp. NPDC056861 TaxID=3154857 RepID=UPI003448A251
MRRLKSTLAAGVVALSAVAVLLTTGAAPAAATSEPTFPLADPDTVLANDGSYVTYGTTVGAGVGARCGATGQLLLPVLRHGSGSSVGMANCASGDAMPDGVGAWAEGAVWAPGVVKFAGKFYLYYTATKAGTASGGGNGHKCIGRAVSENAGGPFRNAGLWHCPAGGRWAIDANPFVSGGKLYVAFRDDSIASGPETGLSVVPTDANGWGLWGQRRSLLLSTDITWDTRGTDGSGTHLVENPSMFRHNDGIWYVAYSGNNYNSVRYATGIASCGANPLPATRCQPLQDGARRPYFGYSGAGDLDPFATLPANHTGPGGMDIFNAADGTFRVVYHYWKNNGGPRYPITGFLGRRTGTGFYVS